MIRDNGGAHPARAKKSRSAAKPAAAMDPSPKGRQRIAKVMARAGLCSRRDAEGWIVSGRVSVNGAVLTTPAMDIGREDIVLVDDAPLPTAEKTRLFLFHKPRGLVTSDHDPEGRPTVTGFLRARWPEGPRVVTVGRLDINTEGLLLLTNDGGLARVLELPRTGWLRRYRVRAKGETDQAMLDALGAGISIDGVGYAGIEAKLDRVQGANCWLTMGLREGKNREVKRVLEHIGLEVNRLIRISFGPFQLLDLAEGAVDEVRTRVLRDQLGESLIAAAGVDFHVIDDLDVEHDKPQPAAARSVAPPLSGRGRVGSRPKERSTPNPEPRAGTREGKREIRRGGGLERGASRHPADASTRHERPVAGTHKHVSKLRADRAVARREGPRKRVDRSDTKDRKSRVVAVERMTAPRGAVLDPTRSHRGGGRDGSPVSRQERGKRPFSQERKAPEPFERSDGTRKWRRKEGQPGDKEHRSPSAVAKRIRVARSGGEIRKSRNADRNRTPEEAIVRVRDQRRELARREDKRDGAGPSNRRGDKPRPNKSPQGKNGRARRESPRGTRASRPKP